MTWTRVTAIAIGVLLVILGFLDYHVQVGAIAFGLLLIGVVSGEQIAALVLARSRPPSSTEDDHDPR